VAYN